MIDNSLKDKLIQDDIWEGDSDTFNGVTSSRVDMQDQYLFDDMDGWNDIGNISSMPVGEIKNIPNRIGALSGAKNIVAGFIPENKAWTSHDPKNAEEKGFTMLSELKDKKYKNVKMRSKIGLYNSLENLLGLAAGFMVGSMGKSVTANVIDDMTYKFTGGLGIAGLIENLNTVQDNMPTAREIVELNLANFYTMYTAKPGRFVRDRDGVFNYVTNEFLNNPFKELYGSLNKRKINPAYILLDKVSNKINGKEETLLKILNTNLSRSYDSSLIISDKRSRYENYLKSGRNNFKYLNPNGVKKVSDNYITRKSGENSLSMYDSMYEEYERYGNYIEQDEKKFKYLSVDGPKKLSKHEDSEESKKNSLDKYSTMYKEYERYENYLNDDPQEFSYLSEEGPKEHTLERTDSSVERFFKEQEEHEKFKDFPREDGEGEQPYNSEEYISSMQAAIDFGSDGKVEYAEIVTTDPDVSNNETFDPSETDNERRSEIGKLFTRVNETFRRIGCLYIEPFYSNGKLECFDIPFEFNPSIVDGGQTAEYETDKIMGRLLSLRSYVGSNFETVTVESTYIATNKYNSKEADTSRSWDIPKNKANWDDGGVNDKWLDGWMTDWTVEKLREVEMKYRSLTLPYIKNGVFVRPPIIRIIMNAGNYGEKEGEPLKKGLEYVGDLFAYPAGMGNDKLDVTRVLDGEDDIRIKRYIATSVKIDPLENWQTSYATFSNATTEGNETGGGYFRYGFKVTVVLAETTKNFLDIVPNYNEYYNAWHISDDEKEKKSHLSMGFNGEPEGIPVEDDKSDEPSQEQKDKEWKDAK